MEKMREEFEAWLKGTGQNPPYATKRGYWEIWKASRMAIEITLPAKEVIKAEYTSIPDYADWPDGYNAGIDVCAKVLVDIGLKVRCADETNIPAQG